MLTSKQRAYLRGLGSTQDDVAQVGKEGLNDACLEGIEKVFGLRGTRRFNFNQARCLPTVFL